MHRQMSQTLYAVNQNHGKKIHDFSTPREKKLTIHKWFRVRKISDTYLKNKINDRHKYFFKVICQAKLNFACNSRDAQRKLFRRKTYDSVTPTIMKTHYLEIMIEYVFNINFQNNFEIAWYYKAKRM